MILVLSDSSRSLRRFESLRESLSSSSRSRRLELDLWVRSRWECEEEWWCSRESGERERESR